MLRILSGRWPELPRSNNSGHGRDQLTAAGGRPLKGEGVVERVRNFRRRLC